MLPLRAKLGSVEEKNVYNANEASVRGHLEDGGTNYKKTRGEFFLSNCNF